MRDVRVLRSFIAPDSLAEIIDDEYIFDAPVTCKMFSKLLRTQDNDHYQVKAVPGGNCHNEIRNMNWITIPRLPDNYTVEFEITD